MVSTGQAQVKMRGNRLSASKRQKPDFGALVISLDFEIHWGVRDQYPPDGTYRQNLVGVRRAIPQMLDLFEEFNIAATWATVGFLFAASRQELESYYPTIQPEYEHPILSPYQEPVGNSEEDDPFHFAPSLIEAIGQRPRQEIGTHTFSHYYCLEQGQSRAAFRADLKSAVAIASKYGLQPRSIVFPRNQVNPNYADLLMEAGITCYRGNAKGWLFKSSPMYSVTPPHEQKLLYMLYKRGARFLDHCLQRWDDVPEKNGLCNVSSSRYLKPYTPPWGYFDVLRLERLVKGIKAAAISKRIFHLWWHPHDFGLYVDENMAFLRKVLEAFARCRERYGMRSLTMGEVAEIVRESA